MEHDLKSDALEGEAPTETWESLVRWVKIYSYWQLLLVAIIVWGAHFFALLGKPWTTCLRDHTGAMDWRCIAFFHIYEVPLHRVRAAHALLHAARRDRKEDGELMVVRYRYPIRNTRPPLLSSVKYSAPSAPV